MDCFFICQVLGIELGGLRSNEFWWKTCDASKMEPSPFKLINIVESPNNESRNHGKSRNSDTLVADPILSTQKFQNIDMKLAKVSQ